MEQNVEMERKNVHDNLQNFIDNLKGSFIEFISFEIDNYPTFDKNDIPFEFKYCNSIRIKTTETAFDIYSSPLSNGLETFWITQSSEPKLFSNNIRIFTEVNNVEFAMGIYNYPFKIKIELENIFFAIYAAEIYETATGLEYKINDEMLLVFDNQNHAEMFEMAISNQMNGYT
jgi:hypothetical protein